MTLKSIKWFGLKELVTIYVQDLGTLHKEKKTSWLLIEFKWKLHESIRFGQDVGKKFFKSYYNMFESKQVSGKEREYGGQR